MRVSSVALTLLLAVGAAACASLPRIQTAQNCDAVSPSSMAIRAVDRSGRSIPFAPIVIVSDNGATSISTSTSSAGAARLPVHPGSYAVYVGDIGGEWQRAKASVKVRPGCVVTLHAELVEHEFAPEDLPIRIRR
jgi:hypothetical protein